MTSLRERQRERRRQSIMDAAATLIGEQGLEETSMEAIAARAEVGTATVYNYFGSKTDLLRALFLRYMDEEAKEGAVALQSPPGDMAEGMFRLLEKYLEGMEGRCSPTLLREFYALAISKQFGYGRDTLALKRRFLEQCVQLAEHYRSRDRIRDGVTAEEAATMCYSAAVIPLSLFAFGMGLDLKTAREMLRRNVMLAVRGVGQPLPPRAEARSDA